jgi:hypothetical protein
MGEVCMCLTSFQYLGLANLSLSLDNSSYRSAIDLVKVDGTGGTGISVGNGVTTCHTMDGGVTLTGRGHIIC